MAKVALALSSVKTEYGSIAQGLIKACKKIGIDIRYVSEKSIDGYDYIIVFHNRPIKINTDARILWWMCDLREPNSLPTASFYAIFICNRQYLESYQKRFQCPAFYLPQTGLPEPTVGEIDEDIVFIGNLSDTQYHENRPKIIQAINENYPVRVIAGERFTKEAYGIYKTTPISLAISPQARAYTSNRLYNILSAGGFCLTLWFPEIETLFENKKHLVWFKTTDEALELIDYYLKNPKERKKIARQGQEFYKKHHTPEHRIWEILKKAQSLKS